jgi:hypothetical protein
MTNAQEACIVYKDWEGEGFKVFQNGQYSPASEKLTCVEKVMSTGVICTLGRHNEFHNVLFAPILCK